MSLRAARLSLDCGEFRIVPPTHSNRVNVEHRMLTHGGSERSRDRKGAVYSHCENALVTSQSVDCVFHQRIDEPFALHPRKLGFRDQQ